MSKGWKIALSVLGGLFVVFLGAVMLLVATFDPTLRGLRPHAVFGGLTTYSVPELAALTDDPQFEAVLIRDEWYEKGGASGWFVLTDDSLRDDSLRFALKGVLDYNPVIFVSGPKSCGASGQPRKAVIALEPSRAKGGFVGRSTCTRAKMDLRNVISRATPVERHVWSDVPQSKYLALRAQVSANPDNGVLLGPINRTLDHQPFERRIYLPLLEDTDESPAYKVHTALREHVKALDLPEGVSAYASSVTHHGHDETSQTVVYVDTGKDALALYGLKLFQPYAGVRCTQAAEAYCAQLTADVLPASLYKRQLTLADMDARLAKAELAVGGPKPRTVAREVFGQYEAYLTPLTETRVSFEFYKFISE